MEKVLLFFDEVEFNDSLRKLSSAKTTCQRIIDQVNEIGAFKIDQTAFVDILQGRGEATARRIEKAVDDELSQARISSASIRKAAVTGDLEKYYTILNAFVRPDNTLWPSLSVNPEGSVIVSPKAEATLREQYTQYIATEAGLACYEAHKKMLQAINEFLVVTPNVRPQGLIPFLGEGETQRLVGLPTGARMINYDRLSNPQLC